METSNKADRAPGQSEEHRRDQVTITIDGQPKPIHRGRRTVAEIKQLGGIPQADVLEQIINGQLVQLDDNGAVVIKGDEVFVSHPRDSASS